MSNRFVEERVTALHLALQIGGFPTGADLARLVDWLSGVVSVVYLDIAVPMCVHRGPVQSRVMIPCVLEDQPLTLTTAHEIGHALSSVGMGALLRQLAPADLRVRRLAQVCEATDERLAREFVYAWCLPSRFLPQYDDYELAELANVSVEFVQARRRSLGRTVIGLQSVPAWSATNTYRVVVHVKRGLLYVVAKGSIEAAFDFPSERRSLEADAAQINLDLLALTTAEFEAKYAGFRAEAPQERALDLLQLNRRLSGGAA